MANPRSEKSKAAARERARAYYYANRERELEKRKKYALANKEAAADRQQKYYAANKAEISAYKKEWRKKNLSRVKTNARTWRKNNADAIRAHKKSDREARPEVYSELARSDRGKWYYYRSDAKTRRGLAWTLSFEEFSALLSGACAYCNAPSSRGVDRVDNTQGYVLGNVVSCCSTCNLMKRNHSLKDFVAHVLKIADRFKNHAPALLGKAILSP